MSDSMLLADLEGRMYDPDGVMQILSEIPGITNLKRGKGDRPATRMIEADYTYGGETTHTRLLESYPAERNEYATLEIDYFNNSGFMLALEFNKRYAKLYGRCLDLSNQGYDFDQRLAENMTLEALMDLIENDPYAGAPPAFKAQLSDNSREAPSDST